jgi:two-component system, OmpR family, sensor kinase
MSGTDILDTETPEPPEPPEPPRHHQGQRYALPRRLSERTPLRTKLITAVLALVIMAIATISVASVYMLRNYVTTQHDNDLTAALEKVFATGSVGSSFENRVTLGTASPTMSNIVEGLQQPRQQLTWGQFSNLPGSTADPLPQLPTDGLWPGKTAGDSELVSVPAQSGTHTWRVLAETVTVEDPSSGSQTTAVLVVAEDIGDINALTLRLILFDLIVGGAIVLVLASVGAAVVQANLRPLNDIELTAGQIAAGHLNHRVPESDPRTEIGSLGRSLNAMLAQVERAFHAQGEAEQAAHVSEERMRRFIADAAHELRTPLTTIRGFAAHYRQRGGSLTPSSGTDAAYSPAPGSAATGAGTSRAGAESGAMSPEELDRLMSRVESEATRMGLLVEDLLTLARLDQQRPLIKAPVDLLTLAADAVQDARIVSPGRPISLSVAPGTAFIVDGDEPRLRQVLANLVNNAITHTPAQTPVRVKIARGVLEPGPDSETCEPVPAVVLDVEDDGPGMAPEQAQRVFERFYRADAARNRASGGTGLGLAIVAGLVSAHGGAVGVRTAPGQGADFQVKLPLSPDVLGVDDSDDD